MTEPLAVVEKRYQQPHWMFFREFRDGTGYSAGRSADALAVGLYQSRGQLLIGFEQKLSRSDWLRELRDPQKAEDICQYCDHWNIVIPDKSIVDLEEVPHNWGLLLTVGTKIRTVKQAPRLAPQPVTRGFMAAIMKRAVDDSLQPYKMADMARHRESEAEGFERGQKTAQRAVTELQELKHAVAEFEKASGIRISGHAWSFDPQRFGRAVRAVLDGDSTIHKLHQDVCYFLNQLKAAKDRAEQSAADLEHVIERAAAAS